MKDNIAVAVQPEKKPIPFPVPLKVARGDDIPDRLYEIYDTIAQRAFEIFENEGRPLGRDLQHWFQAEAELLHPLHSEITEKDKQLLVRVELPGFDARDLDLHLEATKLTIGGERKVRDECKEAGNTFCTECSAERIFRVMELPLAVDPAKAEATLKDGILELRLTKANEARKVKVEARAG